MKYDLVQIEWDDAESDNTWAEVPKELKHALVYTTGWLIKKTKKHILIAHTYTMDGENVNINGSLQIPIKMVLKLEVLKEKAP